MTLSRRSAPLTVVRRAVDPPHTSGLRSRSIKCSSGRPTPTTTLPTLAPLVRWRSGLPDIGSGEALGEAAHERLHSRLGNPMHEKPIEPLPKPTQRRLVGTA